MFLLDFQSVDKTDGQFQTKKSMQEIIMKLSF